MAVAVTNGTDILEPDKLNRLYKRHRQGAFVRTGASLFMWLFALIAYLLGVIQPEHIKGVSYCVGFLILINPPTLWFLKHITHKKSYENFSILINYLEIIGYTAVIYSLGGINALYLSPIYCALIAYVGAVGPSKLPFTIATFCSASLSLMIGLEHFGYLPNQDPIYKLHLPGSNVLTLAMASICLLFVVAFITSYTSSLLRKNKDKLKEQYDELINSRNELKIAADKLKKKNVELKNAVKKARESDLMKSEFLANMSHEFRTPLNHVIGFTELVMNNNLGELNVVQKEYLSDVLDSGKHLLSLINDILDLSKMESGKLNLAISDVNLKEVLEKSMAIVEDIALKHRIQLSLDMDGVPETIRADQPKLKQIMYNLLSNAVKFTPGGGLVRVNAKLVEYGIIAGRRSEDPETFQIVLDPRSDDKVSGEHYKKCVDIAVSDNGIGIRKEDQERIFQRFEQIDASSKKRFQGTGLGLALTKRLVELKGGKIWVESDGEDKGSTFRFIIPT